jgi:CRISPR-associated Csx11 family protein
MNLLKILEQNRNQILLTEIGAYLHLVGRFSEKFIYSNARDASDEEKNFDYQAVCEDNSFFESEELINLLKDAVWKSLINKFVSQNVLGEISNNQINNLCDFIKRHTWNDNPKGLCKILADAHGIVSGIDKALAGRGESGKQSKQFTFRSTAFGYEKEIEFTKNIEVKKTLFQEIKKILENIKSRDDISFDDYCKFVSIIKQYYSLTIGETRRPINEISLYDYAHTIASLTKSNLAKILIDGWYEPRGNSKWKILKVNIDIIGLLSKGIKVGDIFGYRIELEKIFKEIKKIVECKYPLGNEIYRDSTGIYFSFPDINNIEFLRKEIEDEILKILKKQKVNNLDCSLQITISDKSRSMVILAREREDAIKKIVYPFVNSTENVITILNNYSESNEIKDLCPVCKIRPTDESNDRCSMCKERYQKRASKWLSETEDIKETIWLDEVADVNDRVALLIGQFDLSKWLSGEFLDTFVSQTFERWKEANQNVAQSLSNNSLSDLEHKFKGLFDSPSNLQNDDKQLLKSFIKSPYNNFITDFWNPIAERDSTGTALTLGDNTAKAKYLIKLLFRKHPSLSRIYRIWNTTQEFINEDICENILKKYPFDLNLRTKRIQFKIEPNPYIPEGSTCDIDLGFSPVCVDKEKGIFVSTVNLEILRKFGNSLVEIIKNLNGKDIKSKTEINKMWRNAKIIEVTPAEDKFQNYFPYIRIYDFPDQFMILVPAYDAFEIAKRIYEEYELQFSKVRDRLPFHLGIIAFHRRTPLYVAMDAGKRLLNAFRQRTETKEAPIKSIEDYSDDRFGGFVKKIQMSKIPEYSFVPTTWFISHSTGDPEQEDEWHPYLRITGNTSIKGQYSFDYTGNGNYVTHVKELKAGDKVFIEPSYFKMLFLESSSDRFRIDEDLRPIDDIRRLDDLWKDIQKIMKEKNLGITQLYAYWQEVEKRKRDYEDSTVKENFIKATIINIFNISQIKEKELFDKIYQATIDGLLNICLYWNLQVRKFKPGR